MRLTPLKTISATALTILSLLGPTLGSLAVMPALTAPAVAFEGGRGGDCAAIPSPNVRRMCREAGFGGRVSALPAGDGKQKQADPCHSTLMIGCAHQATIRSNGHDAGFDQPPVAGR